MADRYLIRAVGAVIGLGAVSAVLLVIAQAPFAPSRFEYGQYRDYEGRIEEWPCPTLLSGDTRFLLVAQGKHGAADLVRGQQGRAVRLKGALIQRGSDAMLELLPGTLEVRPGKPPQEPQSPIDLGRFTLAGEIVDSKCFLGVMNPGSGKVHRDCAVRCISGGVPPAFLVRDSSGEARVLLLTGAGGRPMGREVLDFVAEPVSVRGRLLRQGARLIFEAEPSGIRRE